MWRLYLKKGYHNKGNLFSSNEVFLLVTDFALPEVTKKLDELKSTYNIVYDLAMPVKSYEDDKKDTINKVAVIVVSDGKFSASSSGEINGPYAIIGQADVPIELAVAVCDGKFKKSGVFSSCLYKSTRKAIKDLSNDGKVRYIRCPIYGVIKDSKIVECLDIQIGATETIKTDETPESTFRRCIAEEFGDNPNNYEDPIKTYSEIEANRKGVFKCTTIVTKKK